ncbi:MAG TPA: hypothetical protein VFW09_13070 [Solirubrobacteraceae bacterium]|nr:hypothetical protein [Solirubrobacteraceae bacterium]
MTARDTPAKAVAHVGVLALLAVAEFMLTLDLSVVNARSPRSATTSVSARAI